MLERITLANLIPPLGGETAFPLGPLYVTSVLEQAGCEVDFRDYQFMSREYPLSQESLLAFLADSHPVLGISCFFNTLPFILPCLEAIKATQPEITIILGGSGPSSIAEKLMYRFPYLDIVVRGEGERTAMELARGVPLAAVDGIVFRRDGKVVANPPRERVHDLDRLPFPAYHKVTVADYTHGGLMTARGCPYRCSFCEVAPLWGRRTERRSVSNVIAEVRLLYERYGIQDLLIHDDTFVLDRSWVLAFCRALVSEGLNVAWRCMGRINLVDEALLAAMARAGCTGIQYGVESGAERVLKRIGKEISVPQIVKVIERSVQVLDSVVATFMWGFPFETMGDFYETLYLMSVVAEMGASIKLLLLSPSPLSALYEEYGHRLRFSEKLVSNLLQETLRAAPAEEKERAIELILKDPGIFPGFFGIDSHDLEKKLAALERLGPITGASGV